MNTAFPNFFSGLCSLHSKGVDAGAGASCGLGRDATRLFVPAERRLTHVHLQPSSALLRLLRVLAVRLRQREETICVESEKMQFVVAFVFHSSDITAFCMAGLCRF